MYKHVIDIASHIIAELINFSVRQGIYQMFLKYQGLSQYIKQVERIKSLTTAQSQF